MAIQYARPNADFSVGDTYNFSTKYKIPIASDSFERANSSDIGDTDGEALYPGTYATGGSDLTWEKSDPQAGGLEIVSNKLTAADLSDFYTYALVDTGHRDVNIITNITPGSNAAAGFNYIGLHILRHEDGDNQWQTWVNFTAPGTSYIYEMRAASNVVRASGTGIIAGGWDNNASNKVQSKVVGRTISTLVAGITLTYSSIYLETDQDTTTKHGTYATIEDMAIHDFAMWAISRWVPPPLSLINLAGGWWIEPTVSDSFDRADSASLGSTDGDWPSEDAGGSGYAWTQAGLRTLTIADNTMQTDGTGYTFATVETNLNDFIMECNQISNSTSTSEYGVLGFRYKDTDNYWIVSASHYAGGWAGFYDKVAGTFYGRGQVFDGNCWNVGSNKFALMVKGDRTSIRMNDDTACGFSYEYAAGNTGYTKHGPAFYTSTVHVDNIAIWPALLYPYIGTAAAALDDAGYSQAKGSGYGQPESAMFTLSGVTDPEEVVILASDSFDRADQLILPADLGETDGDWPSADTGGAGLAWTETWSEHSTQALIVLKDNTLQLTTGSYGHYDHATVDTGESDVVVELNTTTQGTGGTYGMVMLRYVDTDNFWTLQLYAAGDSGYIYEKTAGSWYTRNTTTGMGWTTVGNNKVRGKVAGLNISFGVTGEANQASYTMPSPIHATGTKHGLTIYSSATVYQVDAIAIWKATSDHQVVIRVQKYGAPEKVISLQAKLKEGTTLIGSHTFANSEITAYPTWVDLTWTLDGSEVNEITDYTALSLEMAATDTGGDKDNFLYVTDTYLKVGADAPAGGGAGRFMLLGVGP